MRTMWCSILMGMVIRVKELEEVHGFMQLLWYTRAQGRCLLQEEAGRKVWQNTKFEKNNKGSGIDGRKSKFCYQFKQKRYLARNCPIEKPKSADAFFVGIAII